MYNLIMINKLTGHECHILIMADLVTVCNVHLRCNAALSGVAYFEVYKHEGL